jgi:tetratricopeptide (TPR) repeat protein
LRALIRIAAGDYANAAVDANQAIQLQPTVATYRDTRAYAWLKMGRYDDALGEYQKALDQLQGVDRAAPMMGRGLALAALGRSAEAQSNLLGGLNFARDVAPDPQIDDLEVSARQAFDRIPRAAGVASPVPARPAAPVYVPAASPEASPAALRGSSNPSGRAQ